jgi:hypothetical protein
MTENLQRSRGTQKAYKPESGDVPVRIGLYIGQVRNNVDTARTGQLEVFIPYLGAQDKAENWTKVSFISPFYGTTTPTGPADTTGSFIQNSHSYGMWFTPPDIGTQVVCFFAQGDPNQGYYFGSVVLPERHHMLPAIGTSSNYVVEGDNPYFQGLQRMPVVEVNDNNDKTDGLNFTSFPKPVHQYVAWGYFQQGLLSDYVRGPVNSNGYRESPSTVYGISTPGRPIFQGGINDDEIIEELNSEGASIADFTVVGRRGGHSFVMDDGDLVGQDQLVRIRTAGGHQILMSDSGDTLYVIHKNGQSWWELGPEGTIDMYASNSINLRSADINLHADRSINFNAGASFNMRSTGSLNIESKVTQITGSDAILAYSTKFVGIKSDGTLSLKAGKSGTWDGGKNMTLSAGCIDLNGGKAPDVPQTTEIPINQLPDVSFEQNIGWVVTENAIESAVSRAPSHEPWPLHNTATSAVTDLGSPATPDAVDPAIQEKLDQTPLQENKIITDYEYEAQNGVDINVGKIQPEQVKAMLAQDNFSTDQAYDVISNSIGVGKYGLSPQLLEDTGYIKSGVTDFYLGAGESLTTILESPTVWTGKEGVSAVSDILSDTKLQDAIKGESYQQAFKQLQKNGVITGNEPSSVIAGLASAASATSANSVREWANNTLSNPTVSTTIANKAKEGDYAIKLVEQKISAGNQGFSTSTNSSTGSTIRTTVNQEASSIVTSRSGGQATTTTFESSPPNAQQRAIQAQIDNIDQNVLPQSNAQFLANNPDKGTSDWFRSAEYRAIIAQKDELNSQYVEAGLQD